MKVKWIGKTEYLVLTNGRVYEVLSIEKGWYRIIDDSGEDYLYPPEMFEIVESVTKEIYGFRYSCDSMFKNSVLLRKQDSRTYLDCILDERKFVIDITERVNEICRFLEERKYDQLDGKNFTEEGATCFPPMDWSLTVQTDSIICRCCGSGLIGRIRFKPISELLQFLGIMKLPKSVKDK